VHNGRTWSDTISKQPSTLENSQLMHLLRSIPFNSVRIYLSNSINSSLHWLSSEARFNQLYIFPGQSTKSSRTYTVPILESRASNCAIMFQWTDVVHLASLVESLVRNAPTNSQTRSASTQPQTENAQPRPRKELSRYLLVNAVLDGVKCHGIACLAAWAWYLPFYILIFELIELLSEHYLPLSSSLPFFCCRLLV